MSSPDASTPAPAEALAAPLPAIPLWPAERLKAMLMHEQPLARVGALAMAVQADAPIDTCCDALVHAAQRSLQDPLAAQLAAVALGSLQVAGQRPEVAECLVALVASSHPMAVRISAAHAMFRLKILPPAAGPALCELLLDDDPNARKIALLAVMPFAVGQAQALTAAVAQTPSARWTLEILQAVVASAGSNEDARGKLQAYLLRALPQAPLLPTGVATYAALAQLDSKGPAVQALVEIAVRSNEDAPTLAALDALIALGETARPTAIKPLSELHAKALSPVVEERLCRTLLSLRPGAAELPIRQILRRVMEAPDRGAAANCMLLGMHPRDYAAAATYLRQRFERAARGLQDVLSQTHKTLTGVALATPGTAKEG
jgi:hypothetical protein